MITKLNIINSMLSAVGDDPVTSPDSQYPAAITANAALDRIDVEMQSKGWWFNRDYGVTLSATVAGEVIVPSTALEVIPTTDIPVIQRGTRLYNNALHTFVIGEAVVVNMVSQLPIDQLPEVAKIYLMAKAIHRFYVDDDGDTEKMSQYLREVNVAWLALQQEHLKQLKLNAKLRPAAQAVLQGIRPSALWAGQRNPVYPGGTPQ